MQSQTFKKINLNYRIYPLAAGNAPRRTQGYPLILLHGLMGYASNWGKIWPYFQDKHQVLVLDQRGHGKSEKPAHGYSPSHYASDLLHLMDELAWKRAHIVGHSMGGRVAMQFAHNFSDRIVSLILEDSGAEARPDRLQWIQNLLNKIPTPFPDRESAKKFFDTAFADDPLLGGFLHANIERNESGEFTWRFLPSAMLETIQAGRAQDAMPLFRTLSLPTLIVRGERSDEFSQREAERMRDSRSNVELAVVKGAGHFVHPTHPQEFSQILQNFIAGLG